MSYFNKFLLGGFVQTGTNCTTTSDIFGDGSDLALYRFQGNALDDSGNNFNGTPTNAGFTLTDGAQPSSGARFGGSSVFYDDTSFDSNPNIVVTGINHGNNFTISFWLKVTDKSWNDASPGTNATAIIDKRGAATQNFYIYTYNNGGTDTIGFITYGGGGANVVETAYTFNTWENYILTQNGATLEVFRDSVSQGTNSAGGAVTGTGTDLYIGNTNPSNFGTALRGLNGNIDQLRIFNRAVNATEALDIFEDYKCQPGSTDAFSQCTTDTVGYPVNAAGVAGNGNTLLYYKLDEDPGTTGAGSVTDETGTNNGTPTNVIFGDQGIYGGCARFDDGSSSRIDTGLTCPANSTMTFSFWVYTNNTSGNRMLFGDANAAGNNLSIRLQLRITSTNLLEIIISDGVTSWTDSSINVSSIIEQWSNIVVSINGTAVTVSINGVPTNLTSTVSFGTAGARNFSLGRSGVFNAQYFDGLIDQVRIYDTALSAAQARQLYEEVYCDTGCTTSTVNYQATAVGLWKLDGEFDDADGTYTSTFSGTTPTFKQGRYDLAALTTTPSANTVSGMINTGYTPPTGTGQFTISCWFNRNGEVTTSSRGFFSTFGNNAGQFNGINTYTQASGLLNLLAYNGVGTNIQITSTTVLPTNEFFHIAAVYNAGAISLYLNGTQEGTPQTLSLPSHFGPLTFFGYYTSTLINGHAGLMDQVRVYETALTPAQITNLYNEVSCS